MIAVQRAFLRDHSTSLVGSVALHAALVLAVVWAVNHTPVTRHVVPTVIEASLVSSTVRRYVNPEPPAAAPEPEPAPPPAPRVETPPRAAPHPPVVVKTPPALAPKKLPKVEPKAVAKPQGKPPPTLSHRVESEIDREIRETQQAKAVEVERARQEAERRRAEATRQAQAAAAAKLAAEQQRALAGETAQYVAEVKARVERAWTRPASARKGVRCALEVLQAPTGTVLQAQVAEPCNGDAAVRASIRDAVFRASPLPVPKNPDVFQRSLQLVFSPDE